MGRRLLAAVATTLVLISGCTSVAPRFTGQVPASLEQLQRWQASGRIGVSGGSNGGSGSFDWQQNQDRADVQIRGPVGIGSVRLQMSGDAQQPNLRLQTSNDQVLEADEAWSELQNRLGAAVPAGHLRFWMLGLAAPGEHVWRAPDAQGTVQLEQNGWQIDYQRYSDESGLRLPVRIRASSGTAQVRIVIDRWRFTE